MMVSRRTSFIDDSDDEVDAMIAIPPTREPAISRQKQADNPRARSRSSKRTITHRATMSDDSEDEMSASNFVHAMSRVKSTSIPGRKGLRTKKKQRFEVQTDQLVPLPHPAISPVFDTELPDSSSASDHPDNDDSGPVDTTSPMVGGCDGSDSEEDILPTFGPRLTLDDDDNINPDNVVDLASLGLGDGRDKVRSINPLTLPAQRN